MARQIIELDGAQPRHLRPCGPDVDPSTASRPLPAAWTPAPAYLPRDAAFALLDSEHWQLTLLI